MFTANQNVTVEGRAATVRQVGQGWVHVRFEDTRFSRSFRTDDGSSVVQAA